MNEVRALLERFADEAVSTVPPADVDADVARGRRALRRVVRRRRTTGVLVVAAAMLAVAVIGNPLRWITSGGNPGDVSGVASRPVPSRTAVSSVMLAPPPVRLVANPSTWPDVDCRLVPNGWRRQPSNRGYVVVAPPGARTGGNDFRGKLVVYAASAPVNLTGVTATYGAGRILHLGRTVDGVRVGQAKVATLWVVAQLPIGDAGWTDQTLDAFLNTCTPRPGVVLPVG